MLESIPSRCPSCNSPLKVSASQVDLYCPNSQHCPQQILLRLNYFCGREIADIKGLSVRRLSEFMQKFALVDIYDLYRLPFTEILQLPGYQAKSVTNLQKAIDKARLIFDYKFLAGLSIEGIGIENAKLICQSLESKLDNSDYKQRLLMIEENGSQQWQIPCSVFLKSFTSLNSEELLAIVGLGKILVQNWQEFINSTRYQSLLANFTLLEENKQGVQILLHFYKKQDTEVLKGPLLGKVVCISGTFQESRQILQEKLRKLGAQVVNNVSKKTNVLLVGQNPGSKLSQAQLKGLQIVYSLEELLDSVQNGKN